MRRTVDWAPLTDEANGQSCSAQMGCALCSGVYFKPGCRVGYADSWMLWSGIVEWSSKLLFEIHRATNPLSCSSRVTNQAQRNGQLVSWRPKQTRQNFALIILVRQGHLLSSTGWIGSSIPTVGRVVLELHNFPDAMVTFTGWVGLGTVFNSRGAMQSERDSRLGLHILFVVVHSLSRVRLFAIPWTAARQASLSITNSWNSLKLMSIESVMLSNHLILCHPLLLLPTIFPSIRVFSNESALCIRWPKYWRFSFSISPSNIFVV